jgi:hypothetical protein
VIAIASVPVVLLGMPILPTDTERSSMFDFQNPGLGAAFASHFVHFTAAHLASNVLGNLAVTPLAYLLAVQSGRRRGFRVAYVTFVVAFSLALSALNLVVTRPGVTGGSSGIVMAFLGFVAFVLPEAVSRTVRTDVEAGLRSPWLFFLGLGLVAHLAGPGWLTGVAAAAVLAGLLLFLPVATALGRPAPRPSTGPRPRPAAYGSGSPGPSSSSATSSPLSRRTRRSTPASSTATSPSSGSRSATWPPT